MQFMHFSAIFAMLAVLATSVGGAPPVVSRSESWVAVSGTPSPRLFMAGVLRRTGGEGRGRRGQGMWGGMQKSFASPSCSFPALQQRLTRVAQSRTGGWTGNIPTPSAVIKGRGGIRNRRNSERRSLAQMCAKSCRGIRRSKAISPGVIVSALGIHISTVPNNRHPDASKKQPQPTKGA